MVRSSFISVRDSNIFSILSKDSSNTDTAELLPQQGQKYAECVYKKKSMAKVRVNDFQIVEKGSKLFLEATGKGYEEWLAKQELERMNLLFQRRHIIEHNAGIVDEKYIEKSLDTTYSIGQRIIVRKEDAIELLRIIKKLSTGLKSL